MAGPTNQPPVRDSRAGTPLFRSHPASTLQMNLTEPPTKKRKAAGIDTASMPRHITETLDLDDLARRLGGLNLDLVNNALLASAKTPSVCTVWPPTLELAFSSVENHHLKQLRQMGSVKYKDEEKPSSSPRDKLPSPRLRTIVPRSQRLPGCGFVYLFPVGVLEGQDLCFHGPPDYALVMVDAAAFSLFLLYIHENGVHNLFPERVRDGKPVLAPLDDFNLLTIVEAKSTVTLEMARTQIETQCLALLKAIDQSFFTGALTNGEAWIFYVATANEKNITIYEGPILSTDDGDEAALVVATLIHLIRCPGIMPDFLHIF
ncbi:hypothetical protein DFH07DRAFT_1013510 [Mycena maculata]|uniref:Uncharacterized protein n=1 Tax=Mycena maculata TaxID=230809 RepID=A0AAD7JJP5_9AGAR|nr:hypothetical protein DFH07DRAFT_1013510 [Mycena maculata]